VDPLLGPEMKATGEVMGIAESFGLAFYKAQEALGSKLPIKGNVLLTVEDRDKPTLLPIAKDFHALGFQIIATENTGKFLDKHGVPNSKIKKVHEGRPNIVDAIKNNDLHLIVNTPVGRDSVVEDSYIRMMAIQHKVPYVLTMAAARACVEGIKAIMNQEIVPKALQEYYKENQLSVGRSSL